jgi:CRP-like cAMP-binding protein
MVPFIACANKLSPLDEFCQEGLLCQLDSKTYRKGDFILKAGEVCRQLYFVNEGLVKILFNTEEKEFIMRFFPEDAMFTLLDSYLTQLPARYSIVALEPTELTTLGYAAMETLCKQHHAVETFFRKLISVASIRMMDRISEMLEENAGSRYRQFVNENNALLRRISMRDLASYLGITQVSLSRIRAKK